MVYNLNLSWSAIVLLVVFCCMKVGIHDSLQYKSANSILNLEQRLYYLLLGKSLLLTPWCPANRLEWYKVYTLFAHTSSMVNTVVSLSGLDTILNNNESNSINFSASTSILFIADLLLGNLFWA